MVDQDQVEALVGGLTPHQRAALIGRQRAMFINDCVFARGATTCALRRRGIIAGATPYAELTELGEAVCDVIDPR